MKNSVIILFSCCILFITGCMVSGENILFPDNQSVSNQTNASVQVTISPEERLMDLVFHAREFALENGKDTALSEFSKTNGQFYKDNVYIRAYGIDGTLLANPSRPTDIGTVFISDDYDSGNIRLMRDLAVTGGGLFTDPKTGESSFVVDVDGSWWICATRLTSQDQ